MSSVGEMISGRRDTGPALLSGIAEIYKTAQTLSDDDVLIYLVRRKIRSLRTRSFALTLASREGSTTETSQATTSTTITSTRAPTIPMITSARRLLSPTQDLHAWW